MKEQELRHYIGQMLLQLADLAGDHDSEELERLAFKMRLLADEAERKPFHDEGADAVERPN